MNSLNRSPTVYIFFFRSWEQETSNDYISLEFYWNLGSKADSTSFECGDHITKDFLTLSFPKDPRIDLLSVIEFEELHHFIKEYYLSPESIDFHHFMTVLLTDDQFAGLTEWDAESRDIAREVKTIMQK
ncbi:hypothetical protein TNCV_1538411 [Trichonephila clavipes]|nr:hypothetical protein TNCV_1538411 [Trichonephila clavipes]